MTVTTGNSTQYGGVFIDFDEVWQSLQFSQAPSGDVENTLHRLIRSSCAYAQGPQGTNRPIVPTEFRERHDGWSGEYILLHQSPFLKLVSCTENQSTGGPINLPESTPENGLEGILIDYATSEIMRTFDGQWPRPFFPGARNIEVVYVAGFDPVPDDLWQAAVDLVAWKWRNTQQASLAPMPASMNASFETVAANPYRPGCPPDIQDVFDSYRVPTIG